MARPRVAGPATSRGEAIYRISAARVNDKIGHTQVVFRIVRDQGSALEQRCRGYPGVGGLDSAPIRSGCDHYLGPPQDQVARRGHRGETGHEDAETPYPIYSP